MFINDIGDGGSKADKFIRDIKLLSKGLEENPNNDRYTFYLANSYRDSGNYEKAIEYFKRELIWAVGTRRYGLVITALVNVTVILAIWEMQSIIGWKHTTFPESYRKFIRNYSTLSQCG